MSLDDWSLVLSANIRYLLLLRNAWGTVLLYLRVYLMRRTADTVPTKSPRYSSGGTALLYLRVYLMRRTADTVPTKSPRYSSGDTVLLYLSVYLMRSTADTVPTKSPRYSSGGARRTASPTCARGRSVQHKFLGSVADPWHLGVDPDPDSRIHASD